MDTDQSQRPPLAVTIRNSGIPRPAASRLPVPSATRKRPASEMMDANVHSEGQENGPIEPAPSKKPKLDQSSTQPKPRKPLSATTSSKSTTARPTTTRGAAAKSSTLGPRTSSTAATKKAAITARSTTKPPATAAKATSRSGVSKTVGGTSSGVTGSSKAGTGTGAGKAKRPVWDLKGRLQDMESTMAAVKHNSSSTIVTLQTQMSDFAGRIGDLEQLKVEQEGTIRMQREEWSSASSTIKSLETQLADTKAKLLESTRQYEQELELVQLSKSALQRSHNQIEADLAASRAEVVSLRSAVSQMAADASAIQCRLEATKVARDRAVADAQTKAEEITSLQQQVEEQLKTIAGCHSRIQDDETNRRKLHNTILELKGNIRVFCRVRPFLPSETSCDPAATGRDSAGSSSGSGPKPSSPQSSRLSIEFPDRERDGKKIALKYTSGDQMQSASGGKSYDFDFDHVFCPETSQESVFSEISQLVQSALDGYNVCIFAYGQTGSGKTFTMEGGGEEAKGMIPRAVEQIFVSSSRLTEKGWQYTMEASFLEIYNETLRDLLATNSSNNEKLEIRLGTGGSGSEVYVTNLTVVEVSTQAQVARLLERAAKSRAVAATLCNERSSRSHSVFRLKLTGRNRETGEACQGTLNLIDLAGSERLSSSGSVGERLKETKNINKSLSNLGNVIMALANKDQHIPYRNSRLTYLLQNSLGGNSKTLMFVNISPQAPAFQETLCSLRFAMKVNQCNIGTAAKKVIK